MANPSCGASSLIWRRACGLHDRRELDMEAKKAKQLVQSQRTQPCLVLTPRIGKHAPCPPIHWTRQGWHLILSDERCKSHHIVPPHGWLIRANLHTHAPRVRLCAPLAPAKSRLGLAMWPCHFRRDLATLVLHTPAFLHIVPTKRPLLRLYAAGSSPGKLGGERMHATIVHWHRLRDVVLLSAACRLLAHCAVPGPAPWHAPRRCTRWA